MNIDVSDFVGIAVVGAGLSLVIQYFKKAFGTNSMTTKVMTIALSIVVGGAYFALRQTIWWQTIIGVLAAASAFYAFLLKK